MKGICGVENGEGEEAPSKGVEGISESEDGEGGEAVAVDRSNQFKASLSLPRPSASTSIRE